MAEHVQENLCKDQKHQKSWYDGNAQKGSFQPGDQVLIPLPVPANKRRHSGQTPQAIVLIIDYIQNEYIGNYAIAYN